MGHQLSHLVVYAAPLNRRSSHGGLNLVQVGHKLPVQGSSRFVFVFAANLASNPAQKIREQPCYKIRGTHVPPDLLLSTVNKHQKVTQNYKRTKPVLYFSSTVSSWLPSKMYLIARSTLLSAGACFQPVAGLCGQSTFLPCSSLWNSGSVPEISCSSVFNNNNTSTNNSIQYGVPLSIFGQARACARE